MKRTAGISLMLLIFLSLCLITFSLLSLSGATADEKLSQETADRTTAYYETVTLANKILEEIDTQLAVTLKDTTNSENPEEAYLAACAEITISGRELTWTTSESESSDTDDTDSSDSEKNNTGGNDNASSVTLSYDVSMTDDQHLHVELSVSWPEESSDTLYQITCWKIVTTQDWTRDTSQNLYRTNENR
ncbi:MAG: hypothetical protein LIP11_02900 [Clostridiales bacterium]|nr:hypothetical protein [Clostridiales bacterium]